jgi:hypothetical protein
MIEITNVISSEFSLSAEVSLINAAQNGSFKLTTVTDYLQSEVSLHGENLASLLS